MSFSDGSRVQLSYAVEDTWNTIPAVAFQNLRAVSSGLNYNLTHTTSNEVRSDEQITSQIAVSAASGGPISLEFSFGSYDDFIAGALQGVWTTAVAISATDISAAASDNSLNSTSTDFTAQNLNVGQWIKIAGFTGTAGNNGLAKVVSIATNKVIVSGLTLTDDAAGETVAITGQMIRNGTTQKSFVVQEYFSDIAQYLWFSGQKVSNFNVSIAPGALATGSITLIGSGHDRDTSSQSTGSHTAATTTEPFNAVNNILDIEEGGADLSADIEILDLTFAIDTALRNQPGIGSLTPVGIGSDKRMITGSVNYYFSNGTIYDKYKGDTESSLKFVMQDAAGNAYVISFLALKYNGTTVTPGGNGTDVMVSTNFQAYMDDTLSATMQIDKIPA